MFSLRYQVAINSLRFAIIINNIINLILFTFKHYIIVKMNYTFKEIV